MKGSEQVSQLTAESDNFIINHYEDDTPIINQILNLLEDNYTRITSLLQAKPSTKSTLNVYPNLNALHKAIGRKDAPDWLAGNYDMNSGTIHIVSPSNPGPEHTFDSVMAIAVHEFVHLVAAQINNKAPDYIAEGLATYLAGQGDYASEVIQEDIQTGEFPTMAQLRDMTVDSYTYGYAFMEYVMQKYGIDCVLDLYRTADINKSLNIRDDEFHKNWKAYLTEAYSI